MKSNYTQPLFVIFASALIALALILAVAALMPKQQAGRPEPLSLEKMTLRLLSLNDAYRGVSLAEKPQLAQILSAGGALSQGDVFAELLATARSRKDVFLSLMEENPGLALRVGLSGSVRNKFPPDVQPYIEEEVTLEGELSVLHSDDFQNNVSRFFYFLNTVDGRRFALHFSGDGPPVASGAKVRVHGYAAGSNVVSPSAQVTSSSLLVAATTTKKIGVILFNFQNNITQPYTADFARGVTFTNTNSANAYYQEASFGKLGMQGVARQDGDVLGWYTIPYSNTSCDYSTWASAARSAARSAGVDLTGYDGFVYAFPQTSSCAWWGLGTIGGSPSSAWVNGTYALRVVGHELGHNFGVHHASSYNCTSGGQRVSISDTCSINEYGDLFDIMGGSTNHHDNAHKDVFGWFSSGNIATVTSGGTFTLAPQEQASQGLQAIRIPHDTDTKGNVTNYYYLEYREPYGFDNFSTTSAVVSGVSLRLAPPPTTVRQSWLIDATPETTSFSDSALPVGRTLNDVSRGISITDLGVSTSGATVGIAFSNGTCVRNAPSISLSPVGQWGNAGQPLVYTLTVSSNDSSACDAAPFNVVSVSPAGWSETGNTSQITLAPGSAVSMQITITSVADAADGYYQFTHTVTNTNMSSLTASVGGELQRVYV